MYSPAPLIPVSRPSIRQWLFLLAALASLSINASGKAARAKCCRMASRNHLTAMHPVARRDLDAAMHEMKRRGIRPRLTTSFRSRAEQSRIYHCSHKRRCRQRRGIYAAARPGASMHEAGLAVDLGGVATGSRRHRRLTRHGRQVVQIMRRHGFNWRYGMKDPVHFEINPHRAGYRSERVAIRAGQQRWIAQSHLARRHRGRRSEVSNRRVGSRSRLQKVSNLRPLHRA